MVLSVRPDRRLFLTAGLAAALLPGLSQADTPGAPASGALRFKVYRKGAMIGEHRMSFSSQAGGLSVQTEVEFAVGLGPLTLFHYTHRASETWTGGRFERLQTATSTNGKKQAVKAHRTADGVMIEPAEGAPYLAETAVLPLTHWNRKIMAAPLFNPQDGKALRERATPRGSDTVSLADGRSVTATRYSLAGESQIDDWYDQDGVWAALRGKVKDGSVLDYRRADA